MFGKKSRRGLIPSQVAHACQGPSPTRVSIDLTVPATPVGSHVKVRLDASPASGTNRRNAARLFSTSMSAVSRTPPIARGGEVFSIRAPTRSMTEASSHVPHMLSVAVSSALANGTTATVVTASVIASAKIKRRHAIIITIVATDRGAFVHTMMEDRLTIHTNISIFHVRQRYSSPPAAVTNEDSTPKCVRSERERRAGGERDTRGNQSRSRDDSSGGLGLCFWGTGVDR